MVRLVFRPLYSGLTNDLHVNTASTFHARFPSASAYPSKVHHLSGPNRYAHNQGVLQRIMVGRCCRLRLASVTFITRVGFSTSTLAYVLDSLVRVSRRVGKNHFGKIAKAPQAQSPPENLPRRINPFCGGQTPFCLTTKTKVDVSSCAPSSPCGSNKVQ